MCTSNLSEEEQHIAQVSRGITKEDATKICWHQVRQENVKSITSENPKCTTNPPASCVVCIFKVQLPTEMTLSGATVSTQRTTSNTCLGEISRGAKEDKCAGTHQVP
jgi:hypothetical protein